MALQSDITLDVSKFRPSSVLPQTAMFNERLMDSTAKGPKLFEIEPHKFRDMIHAGQTSIPKPVLLESAETVHVPSRESGRSIPCRVLRPQDGVSVKAVFMHMHLGGWTIGDETSHDQALQRIADEHSLLCISVGYRLAPEHPFPAGPEDCFDVAEWLVDNASSTFGAELSFMGGESAGAHLAVLAALALKRSPKYSAFRLKGLLLHFGVFDLSGLPQTYNFKPSRPLLIEADVLRGEIAAFCPGMSAEQLKSHMISPFYDDLAEMDLPPALFTVGTEDLLTDDTVFMAVKWMVAGAETILKIYPGASHAYLGFPEQFYPATKAVFEDVGLFVRAQLE